MRRRVLLSGVPLLAAALTTSGCTARIVGDVAIERGADGTLRVLVIDCAGTLSGVGIRPERIEASAFAASPTSSGADGDSYDDAELGEPPEDSLPEVWTADFDRRFRGLRVISLSEAPGVRLRGTMPGSRPTPTGGSENDFTLMGGGGPPGDTHGDATGQLLFTARQVRALKPSTVLRSTGTVTTRAQFARYCDGNPRE